MSAAARKKRGALFEMYVLSCKSDAAESPVVIKVLSRRY
jgi:hypothetical protein